MDRKELLREMGLRFVRDPKEVSNLELRKMLDACKGEMEYLDGFCEDGGRWTVSQGERFDKLAKFAQAIVREQDRRGVV